MSAQNPQRIVVVGAGMVGHRFVESLLSREDLPVRVALVGDEGRLPYDRVGLTGYLTGRDADELTLDPDALADERVEFVPADPVAVIDRSRRRVRLTSGRFLEYDRLVLATGSYAARLALDGFDLPGCFVYRTIDDLEQLRTFVERRREQLGRPLRGYVVGGGLLGLEAAEALGGLEVTATVVQSSDRLMSAQLDVGAGSILRRLIEARGIGVRTETVTTRLDPDRTGQLSRIAFRDGTDADVDVAVFTVGVRPRDELARDAQLECHPRGGVIIDDACQTSDPAILAIGEVANFDGMAVGLVAPGYAMAEVAASRLSGGDATFPGFDLSAKLKFSGIDVASFGDAMATTPGALDVVYADPTAGVYKSSCCRTTPRRCSAASSWAMPPPTGRCDPWSAEHSARTRPSTSRPRSRGARRWRSCPMRPSSVPARV